MAVKIKHRLGDKSARLNGSQNVQYLHATFTPTDIPQTGCSTAEQTCRFKLGVLPAYSVPLETYVYVRTICTANVLVVGTSSGSAINNVVSTVDVAAGTSGLTVVDRYYGTMSTADQALYVATLTTACTGGGLVEIWQTFLPINQPTTS